MTIDEAIRILQYPVYRWSMDWDEREDGLCYPDAINIAISALRAQQEAKKNEPLTPEELREMNGYLVWIEYLCDGYLIGCTIKKTNEDIVMFQSGNWEWVEDYGKTWLAYRHPPERQ